jgi:glycosyltransferase involved in cell wall biosynthesis
MKIMRGRNRANVRFKNQVETKDRMRKKLAVTKGPKKICVTGIMRNESNNIDRLFDSLLLLPPDMISIVDTGSTDDTEEKILSWGKKHNIPTVVHHEPFKDFAHNRTHSIKAAKEAFPDADYFLLTDADFVWEINKGNKFDKALLVDHKYLIEQYNKALSYWNVRLLSAKVNFSCIGATHEYWEEDKKQHEYCGEVRTGKIKTLVIDDREDGGCKTDKFERDERLLRGGLNDSVTPKDLKTRYKFYLGQTLKDTGRYEESIEWYQKRIVENGWPEEVYYAKFQIGFDYEQLAWGKKHAVAILGKTERSEDEENHLIKWNPNNKTPSQLLEESTKHFEDAAVNYLAAHTYRKSRVESIYYLTRMYRLLGRNDIAYKTAMMGNKVPYPEEDTLFIESSCYDYLFDFEISIVAFYLPEKKDLGRQAISRLIVRDDLPQWINDIVLRNSRLYI